MITRVGVPRVDRLGHLRPLDAVDQHYLRLDLEQLHHDLDTTEAAFPASPSACPPTNPSRAPAHACANHLGQPRRRDRSDAAVKNLPAIIDLPKPH